MLKLKFMCFIGKIVFHEDTTGEILRLFPGLEEKGREGGKGSFSKLGSCYVFKNVMQNKQKT